MSDISQKARDYAPGGRGHYPYFQEIINEMQARPEADPVGILEENISPLLDACNKINLYRKD